MIITVGMADLKCSHDRGDSLITYALGSCLGIVIHDPVAGVGGMLHTMLPDSAIDVKKRAESPYMFIDTGVPLLFHECYRLGAQKSRMTVRVAGGATARLTAQDDYFRIGERNFVALRKLLWKNNVLLEAHDVGGTHSRTMTLNMANGAVSLRINNITTVMHRREEASSCP
jgi:chemotaxis protein CheD